MSAPTTKRENLMDVLETAAIKRLQQAVDVVELCTSKDGPNARAKAFEIVCRELICADRHCDHSAVLARSSNPLVAKAGSHILGNADLFNSTDARALAESYCASIAEFSLLDAVKPHATTIPPHLGHMLFASWASGDEVAEGEPKLVKKIPGALRDAEIHKVAAIVASTNELIRAVGGTELFEAELRRKVTRGTNNTFLSAIVDSNLAVLAGSGDPLADLRTGLNAAAPSEFYCVAASTKVVNNLATRVENSGGMTPRGGLFCPGVQVVAVDEMSAGWLYVIAASRIALEDHGMRVAQSDAPALNMADSPTAPSEVVSLFQANARAILVERAFRVAVADEENTVVRVGL
jgi:hypothetical protein